MGGVWWGGTRKGEGELVEGLGIFTWKWKGWWRCVVRGGGAKGKEKGEGDFYKGWGYLHGSGR